MLTSKHLIPDLVSITFSTLRKYFIDRMDPLYAPQMRRWEHGSFLFFVSISAICNMAADCLLIAAATLVQLNNFSCSDFSRSFGPAPFAQLSITTKTVFIV